MPVLMIRAGEHPSDPPRTLLVLESEVARYEKDRWVRIATDPGQTDPTPPRARFNGLKFLPPGCTGD
jgi:hypothetical protein